MPPDINSLLPSCSTSSSPMQSRAQAMSSADAAMGRSPSRRSSSVSLAAAASINAADLSRRSSTSANRASPQAHRAHERRRSTVAMNLSLNDPTLPGPGELSSSDHRSSIGQSFRTASSSSLAGSPVVATGDPHHHRTPSLGELHQELEQEQEAQVNRLLLLIRQQQAQLQQLQQQQAGSGSAVIDDLTPASERSVSLPNLPPLPHASHRSSLHLGHGRLGRRGSNQMSPTTGFQTDPASNTTTESSSVGGEGAGRRGSCDESSFYQAETAMLTRENQMLRMRIRELERQISELTASNPHAPATSSQLASSSSAGEETTPSDSEAEPSSRTHAAREEKT
ncbi:hypothetical protein VTO42DRAFT_1158 [Malbranchea cinnamomea]